MINTSYTFLHNNRYNNIYFQNKCQKQKGWNEVYATHTVPWDSTQWRKMSADCVDGFLTENDKYILDYGFGTGHLLEHLMSKGNKVFGAEKSSDMVQSFKHSHPKVTVIQTDHPNQIKNEKFDAITCMGVFHHINPKEYDSMLKSFSNMLKPKGKLVLGGWDKDDKNFNGKPFVISPYSESPVYTINHPDHSIEYLLKQNNLRIVNSKTIGFNDNAYSQDRLFKCYYIEKIEN